MHTVRNPRFFTKLDRVSFIVGYYNYDSLFVSLCHLKKPNRQAPKIGFYFYRGILNNLIIKVDLT